MWNFFFLKSVSQVKSLLDASALILSSSLAKNLPALCILSYSPSHMRRTMQLIAGITSMKANLNINIDEWISDVDACAIILPVNTALIEARPNDRIMFLLLIAFRLSCRSVLYSSNIISTGSIGLPFPLHDFST